MKWRVSVTNFQTCRNTTKCLGCEAFRLLPRMCVAYNYITNGAVLHQRCNSRNLQCVHALRHKDMLLSRPVGQGMTFPWSGLLAHLDVAGQVWDYWPKFFTSRSASQAGRNDMKFGSRFLSAIGETKRKRWQNRFWLIYLLLLFRPEKVSLRRAQGSAPGLVTSHSLIEYRSHSVCIFRFTNCVCVWNIWKDVKLLTHALIVMIGFFLFCGPLPSLHLLRCRGTIHVLCAMVQRSGHSTCGYHGWSPWRTCNFFCDGKRLNPKTSKSIFLFQNASNQNQIIQFHVSTCTVFAIWLSCIRTS